jgi:hypothetical protein
MAYLSSSPCCQPVTPPFISALLLPSTPTPDLGPGLSRTARLCC